MEWKLSEERQGQYSQAIQSAQETESTIGALSYKLFKFSKMREEIDESLKVWWDQVLKEMNLDKNRNYMITKDGLIKDVTQDKKEVTVETKVVEEPKNLVGGSVTELP